MHARVGVENIEAEVGSCDQINDIKGVLTFLLGLHLLQNPVYTVAGALNEVCFLGTVRKAHLAI